MTKIRKISVTNLTVSVTYKVNLTDGQIPEIVFNQLKEAFENGGHFDYFSENDEDEAAGFTWLINKINESDSFEWTAIIEELEGGENE